MLFEFCGSAVKAPLHVDEGVRAATMVGTTVGFRGLASASAPALGFCVEFTQAHSHPHQLITCHARQYIAHTAGARRGITDVTCQRRGQGLYWLGMAQFTGVGAGDASEPVAASAAWAAKFLKAGVSPGLFRCIRAVYVYLLSVIYVTAALFILC